MWLSWLIVMCRFFYIFRMLFRNTVPIDDEEESTVPLNDEESQEPAKVVETPKIPPNLEFLPVLVIANVASRLEFNDVVSFRQVSHQMNRVYRSCRNNFKGADIHVFVNIENGQVVTTFRGHRQLRGEARLVSPEYRDMIFRNADVTLTLRLGDTPMTVEAADEILDVFGRSNIERVQLRGAIVSRETKDLINGLECSNVELNIGRYNDNVKQVLNIKELRVREHLLFFQLETVLAMNIKSMSVRVTAASMPVILECIEEWKNSQREILSWFFKIPIVDAPRVWEDLPIDWRRSITIRHDRSARLHVNSRIEPLEAGDLIQYQTLSWFSH